MRQQQQQQQQPACTGNIVEQTVYRRQVQVQQQQQQPQPAECKSHVCQTGQKVNRKL